MALDVLSRIAYMNGVFKISIDNAVFKLHYRVTVALLLLSFIIITSKQFFGNPIYCMVEDSKQKEVANSYCWIHGTFVLKKSPKENIVGKHVVSPGVGAINEGDEIVHHKYYQWVCIVLLVQCLMFYTPFYLWKIWENQTIKRLSSELDGAYDLTKWTPERKSCLIDFFTEGNSHTLYALRFAFCEILNLVNVVFQMLMLNWFLGGSFQNYGPAIASFLYDPSEPNSVNPMDWAFPKMSKCTFYKVGFAGSLEKRDYLCILPLNIVNEKLYAGVWMWFVFLIAITSLAIIYRMLIFCCPILRAYVMSGRVRTISRARLFKVFKKFGIGDWFILNLLSKNVNPMIFKDIIKEFEIVHDKKSSAFI